MVTEEMIAVMQAYIDGEKIEYKSTSRTDRWDDADVPSWQWGTWDYRVKEVVTYIPWDLMDPRWKYFAIDEDGSQYIYVNPPTEEAAGWYIRGQLVKINDVFKDLTVKKGDWRHSLITRPE